MMILPHTCILADLEEKNKALNYFGDGFFSQLDLDTF
jgi:hypothetical protein